MRTSFVPGVLVYLFRERNRLNNAFIGQTISHYRIVEKLGVALKFLPKDLARNAGTLSPLSACRFTPEPSQYLHDPRDWQAPRSFLASWSIWKGDTEAPNLVCRWTSKQYCRLGLEIAMLSTRPISSGIRSSQQASSSPNARARDDSGFRAGHGDPVLSKVGEEDRFFFRTTGIEKKEASTTSKCGRYTRIAGVTALGALLTCECRE